MEDAKRVDPSRDAWLTRYGIRLNEQALVPPQSHGFDSFSTQPAPRCNSDEQSVRCCAIHVAGPYLECRVELPLKAIWCHAKEGSQANQKRRQQLPGNQFGTRD